MTRGESSALVDDTGARHLGSAGLVGGDERVEVAQISLRAVLAKIFAKARPYVAVTRHDDHWLLRGRSHQAPISTRPIRRAHALVRGTSRR